MRTDVIIIGAGLAGAVAASTLARAGLSVALIDARAETAPEFRAEKMGEAQIAQLARLGLADAVMASVTEHRTVKVARFGRIVGDGHETEYGYHYADLVNALRRAMPADVTRLVGRIDVVSTTDDRQRVTLTDGTVVDARLLVLATGLGDAIRRKIGIDRCMLSRSHSLALGFDLRRRPQGYDFDTLVCYPRQRHDRIAYVGLFRIGDTMRGNLFAYRTIADDWTKRFRAAPRENLLAAIPELEPLCGRLDLEGEPDVRSIDLTMATNYRRDGVVLIGDAFRTCCPIIGMGVPKVLTDAERLGTVHAPEWFRTPGMGAAKIGTFYDDPIKRQTDARGHAISLYSRRLSTDPGWVWSARRGRNLAVRQGLSLLKQAGHALHLRPLPQPAGAHPVAGADP